MASECVNEIVPMDFAPEEEQVEVPKGVDLSAVLQDRRQKIGKDNSLVKTYSGLLFCLMISNRS